MKQGFRWRIVFLLILIVSFFSRAQAKEGKEVRVAFFPMNSYHTVLEDGSYGGIDVEYLSALSLYTDWKIKYVSCDNWEDALDKLQKKEVDLVGSAQYSKERAKIFTYATVPSGNTFGVIFITDESPLAYEDFDAMKSMTFGVTKDYVKYTEFMEYLSKNGIKTPKIKKYDSTDALMEALDREEIQIAAHTFMELRDHNKVVGQFAHQPFYYITWKGNEDMMEELDEAQSMLTMDRPELKTELMNNLYQSKLENKIVLSGRTNNISQRIAICRLDG